MRGPLRDAERIRLAGSRIPPWAIPLIVGVGCADGGHVVDLPAPDAVLTFLVRHDENRLIGIERLPPRAEGAPEPASNPLIARAGETISLLTLRREDILATDITANAADLDGISLELREGGETCAKRFSSTGAFANLALPDTVPVWRLEGTDPPTFDLEPLPRVVLQALRLQVPLGACRPPLSTRPFAKDGRALASPFSFRGQLRQPDVLTGVELDLFVVNDAVYLDRDVALVVFDHGLVLLGRGGQIESDEASEYFSGARLPGSNAAGLWNLRSVAVRPATADRPLRMLVAAFRRSAISGEFDGLAALLSLDGGQFEVLSSTVTLGFPGRAGLDGNGRLLVAMTEGATDHQRTVVFAEPDATNDAFEIVQHSQDIKTFAATPSPLAPHAILTRSLSRVQIGDLKAGRFIYDDLLPLPTAAAQSIGRSLHASTPDGRLLLTVGTERGEILDWHQDDGWHQSELQFDARFRASACYQNSDTCGRAISAQELGDVWSYRSPDGASWTLTTPLRCPHIQASRRDGCSSLIEVSGAPAVAERRTLNVLRPAPDGNTALIGGLGGLLVEVAP